MAKKKQPKLHSIFQKSVLSKLHIEVVRTGIIVLIVLGLTWGVAKATENELESATSNFSVIGTVSSISNESISLIDARGSDTQTEELYNLSIKYIDRVETREYALLVVSDIKPGDTIIAQGLTDGNKFFIKRIISFNATPLPVQEEIATTTAESIATSTEEVQSEDTSDAQVDTDDSSMQEETATTSESIATSTEETATTTNEQTSTSTDETASSTTEIIIDTITNVIEDGLDTVSDVVDTIVDTVMPQEEVIVPSEEVVAPQEVQGQTTDQ